MLVAQAQLEGLTLVTADAQLAALDVGRDAAPTRVLELLRSSEATRSERSVEVGLPTGRAGGSQPHLPRSLEVQHLLARAARVAADSRAPEVGVEHLRRALEEAP